MSKTFIVRNYKAIEEVEITSGVGLVVLGGKNAQGKSSFLDGVREVVRFVGKRETPEPIRLGEDEASVEIIDEERDRRYVRTFKRAKSGTISSDVAVYALDGARYEKGAQVIAEDVGAEIIDAAQFAMLGARDQRDTLLRQVELPFDLDELARQKKGVEDERKIANAEVKRLQGALASIEKPSKDTPEDEVSAGEVVTELREAESHNREVRDARENANLAERRIIELEAELKQVRHELEVHKAKAAEEQIDVIGLRSKLDGIEEINAAVRAGKQYRSTEAQLGEAEKSAKAAQDRLDRLDRKKRDALTAANFPDPLLSVDDEQVLYDGVPFTQVNSAKQIGIGFDIATLAHRDLKIGFIKNGDLLDDESLSEIEKRAIERGYTILCERGRTEGQGWVFHEGTLAE